MTRPQKEEYSPYFEAYISLTRGADAIQNIEDSSLALVEYLTQLPPEKHHYAYAEGKWTIAQMLRHIIDTDLVFCYRAISLSRTPGGNLEGFDHEVWADNSLNGDLNFASLLQEFNSLRKFALSLFSGFSEQQLSEKGVVNHKATSVRSIPFVMAGHTLHHLNILRTKY